MRTLVLIFSILISFLGLIIGQFVYPFIASLFDGSPTAFAAIIGILIVVILSIIVCVATKEKFYRKSVIIPCLISVVATFLILLGRFYGESYRNGYCNSYGLKNSLGITIIDDYIDYMGVDSYGNNVFVHIDKDYDYDWSREHDEEKYEYTIRWYDESGNYLGGKEFTKYYDYDDDKLSPGYYGSYWDDARYIAENWAGIELYKVVG